MAVSSLFYGVRRGNLPRESDATAERTATSGQPKLENAGQRHMVHNPVRGVQQFVARKLRTAQTIAAKEADPVELWKAVKRGSVNAEVALANLYLEGEAVPRNCEQAHMLLYAASMKGSKAADNFLKSAYAERCE
jgi:TPR repeat protein